MDFKGITWAGNIYQKFEDMCLEVEEAMYQDTVKYVENQVQKVGISVKKFYSEVMEDLLPPSCVGPINLASSDLSLNPYGDTDVKMPIPSLFDSPGNLKKKENEDVVISNGATEKASSLSGCYDINTIYPQSSATLVQNKCSKSCLVINKKVGLHRRPVGIKKISKNNHPSEDTRRITSLSGDRRSKFASIDMSSSSRVASDDKNLMMSPSDLNVSYEPGETVKGNAPIPVTPIESPASNKILAAETVRQNENDSECISPFSDKILSSESMRQNKNYSNSISPASESNLLAESERLKGDSVSTSSCYDLAAESTGSPVNDVSFSLSGSGVRIKACNLETEDKEVMVSNEGTSMKDGLSSVSTTCKDESWDKEIIMSNEDILNMEVIENAEVSEPRSENFEPVGMVNLEESCHLVEGNMLQCVPQETRKHKSYKKKIREALSSKFRSSKDLHCVYEHRDLGRKSNLEAPIHVLAMDSEKKKSPAHDSLEFDWELL